MSIDVLIPALNEAKSIGLVLRALPPSLFRKIIVCDNGSCDGRSDVARQNGAIVVTEEEKGYGAACLRAVEKSKEEDNPPDILLFLDADFSDHPEECTLVLDPILRGEADLVVGSRVLGSHAKGSLTEVQRFGNWLATMLIRMLYQVRFTDLGPFRAIRWDAYCQLGMRDRNFGWTVEMQVRAAKLGLRCIEVPVSYKKRIGTSKVSGTISGSIRAGYKILYTIFKLA